MTYLYDIVSKLLITLELLVRRMGKNSNRYHGGFERVFDNLILYLKYYQGARRSDWYHI